MTTHSNHTWLELYRKLGYLFYAIAAADRQVAAAEADTLKTILRETWLPLEESLDEFDSDAAYQMLSVFDWLLEEARSAEKAFEVFEQFLKANPTVFSAPIKARIMETADRIATSFRNRNKSELTLLFRLNQLLGGNP